MRRIGLAITFLFGLAASTWAQAQYPDSSSPSVSIGTFIQKCLNSSNQAVLCSDPTATKLAVTATNQTGTTTQTKVTIAVTNTYQQALASSATRKGCTIQYIAVAGTKGYVFVGSTPGDTTTSWQLTNGQTFNCQTPGMTLTDAIQVTGTGTDIFIVANQ